MKSESLLMKIARLIKYLCRRKLDKSSWLEVEGPECYWYCEKSRRFRFYREVINRNAVVVHLKRRTEWESSSNRGWMTEQEYAAIASKLQKHFEREWGQCNVSEK